jgi:hypothetical protein
MDESREKALQNDYEKSTKGRTNFLYVDTKKTERLGIPSYRTVTGDNFIRIISPTPTGYYRKEVFVHSKVGANGATFLCLKKMFNKPCPVCEYIEQLKAEGGNDEQAAELAATRRYLFFVYNVANDETEAKGLHWYDAPSTILNGIVGLSKDKRTGKILDVSSPKDGRDIEFTRKGSGLLTKYDSFKLVDNNPIPDEWLKDVPAFDDILLIPTYDQVKKEVTGIEATPPPEEKEVKREEEVAGTEEVEIVKDTPPPAQEAKTTTRTRTARTDGVDPAKSSVQDKLNEIRTRRSRGQGNG